MPIRELGNPPMLVYFTSDEEPTLIDREETDYSVIDRRELELLLSLLNFAAARVRRELRRRVGEPWNQ